MLLFLCTFFQGLWFLSQSFTFILHLTNIFYSFCKFSQMFIIFVIFISIRLIFTAKYFISHFIKVIKSLNSYSDRKSTRLNSSHVRISYAVFCLKKKKKKKNSIV